MRPLKWPESDTRKHRLAQSSLTLSRLLYVPSFPRCRVLNQLRGRTVPALGPLHLRQRWTHLDRAKSPLYLWHANHLILVWAMPSLAGLMQTLENFSSCQSKLQSRWRLNDSKNFLGHLTKIAARQLGDLKLCFRSLVLRLPFPNLPLRKLN